MVKLLIINITKPTPQNRVSNTIMHVTLNTINVVIAKEKYSSPTRFLHTSVAMTNLNVLGSCELRVHSQASN